MRKTQVFGRQKLIPKILRMPKKYSDPERKVLKDDVRKGISSFISSSMARTIKDTKRPTKADFTPAPPSAETLKNLRFSLPDTCRQKEESVMGVSIQPSGTYPKHQFRSASVSSSSPRSTPDPAEINISRHSLSQAFHEKNGRQFENGGYTMK